jgi:sigma-B regulation protein RsbU (phosphoserine phosphatase)
MSSLFFLPYDASAIWLLDSSLSDITSDQNVPSFQLGGFRCQEPYDASSIEQLLLYSVDGQEDYSSYPWLAEILNSNFPQTQSAGPAYEPLGATLGFQGPYSAIATPLSIGNLKLGIIVCVDHAANRYEVDHLSIIKTFSGFITIALENSRLYQAAHAQAWMSTVLLQVAEATQSLTNLEELLDTVVHIFPDLLGISASAIFLWDLGIDAFAYNASFGFENEQSVRWDNWDINQGSVRAFEEIKNSKRPVILNSESISEADVDEIFPDYDLSNDLLILFPLVTQNTINGALLVDFTGTNLTLNSPQEVWDEKYTLIQGAAQQTAIAIENLQLIKSQEEEAYISLALLQVAQAVVSLNQLDEILSTIVRITPILVGVKRCILYLWDAKVQRLNFSQSFGFSKNELAPLKDVLKLNEFPLIEALLENDRIIYHSLKPDITPTSWIEISPGDYQIIEGVDPDSDDEISIKLDERSLANRERLLIGLPLSIKNEILGVMLIEEEDPIKGSPSIHVREKRIEIVRGITQQAAISIKNELLQQEAVKSERMERELQLAREIQAAFLPDKLPEIVGWDVDARWQPARQVGGDFYDVLILDKNQVGFVIADVADKGMPAALFMTLIRTLIRATAKENLSPAEILTQVNELLYPDAKQGMFVTVFYAVISVNSGRVIYANAGHNPPIVKRFGEDELIELTRTSIALGIFEHIQSDEHEMVLNPGDWLIMYTDGVTEAFSPSEEMFGKERLFNLINSGKFNSSTDFADLLEKTISDFIIGTDLSDDLTITSVHRLQNP